MKQTKIIAGDQLYIAALKASGNATNSLLHSLWAVFGLAALVWCAWAEPFSLYLFEALKSAGIPDWLIQYVGLPLVMALRAVVLVESAGYAYHRFFQHLGFFTRRAQVFRRNQRFHWIHHMVIYPIGRFYTRHVAYVPAEKGLPLSWLLPALLGAALFISTHGINFASLVFIIALALYVNQVIDKTHSRFHETNHPWSNSPYFQWLEKIHLLHHWDQRFNFTIVHPAMDMLFGTYLSPAQHEIELKAALEDHDLTVSDVINWRYLLIEASPTEHAAFISAAKKHRRGVRKLTSLIALLEERMLSDMFDRQAQLLHQKAVALKKLCA